MSYFRDGFLVDAHRWTLPIKYLTRLRRKIHKAQGKRSKYSHLMLTGGKLTLNLWFQDGEYYEIMKVDLVDLRELQKLGEQNCVPEQ